MRRRPLLGLAAASLAAPFVGTARAQGSASGNASRAWPERSIRLIVPWPPGGSTDTVARIVQPRLQEVLGKPLVIDNRGGASGSIGAVEAARAPADGYTWLLSYDTQATNETVMRLPFRTMEAFTPVCLLADGPLALVAHRTAPWNSLDELIADAKQHPERIQYATSGVGGLAHVATTLLQQQGGFRLTHVPYRGGGPAVQDAVAGHVPLFMSNVVIISQHMRDGTLKPLGVTTPGESPHVPGVRSFAQQGFPDFQAPTWWMLLAPANTPAPIVVRMQQALAGVLAEPEVRRKITEQGADVRATDPAQCAAFLRGEIDKWGKVIRDNDIRADS